MYFTGIRRNAKFKFVDEFFCCLRRESCRGKFTISSDLSFQQDPGETSPLSTTPFLLPSLILPIFLLLSPTFLVFARVEFDKGTAQM